MRIIRIEGHGKLENYSPCTFIITRAEGKLTIFSESSVLGFVKREDITISELEQHIRDLQAEGFAITKTAY